MGTKGTQNAQMQGPRPNDTGEQFPWIVMAEGYVPPDGLCRI
jgi:hypothetical protein